MSDQYSFSETSGLKQSELEIPHVFNQHVNTLNKQKWKIVDQITEWSTKLISQIQEHVSNQKQLLEQVYEKKVSYINIIRDRFLEQALLYEQKQDITKMNELIERCNTLKFELAVLMYHERPIVSVQLLVEEQLPHTSQNESKIEEEQSQTVRIENSDNEVISQSNTHEKISLTSTSAKTQPTYSLKKSTNEETQLSISNVDLIYNHRLVEKCPTCFMIFPQSMTAYDRNVHINEHFQDD